MSIKGFAVTTAGRYLLAQLAAEGSPLNLTRAMFGTGKLPEGASGDSLLDQTALVEPLAAGVFTRPEYKNSTLSLLLQFRSDLNGGLQETVWLNEFGLYAENPSGGETLICYGNLGDYPDSVLAYRNGACTVREYPITILIEAVPEVTLAAPAGAFVTSEDAKKLVADEVAAVLLRHFGSLDNIARLDADGLLLAGQSRYRWRAIRARERDPGKPDFNVGGGGEEGAAVLRVSDYTGSAEVSAMLDGIWYDVNNMSVRAQDAMDGTLIIKKE